MSFDMHATGVHSFTFLFMKKVNSFPIQIRDFVRGLIWTLYKKDRIRSNRSDYVLNKMETSFLFCCDICPIGEKIKNKVVPLFSEFAIKLFNCRENKLCCDKFPLIFNIHSKFCVLHNKI
jgi:hypothetical protein